MLRSLLYQLTARPYLSHQDGVARFADAAITRQLQRTAKVADATRPRLHRLVAERDACLRELEGERRADPSLDCRVLMSRSLIRWQRALFWLCVVSEMLLATWSAAVLVDATSSPLIAVAVVMAVAVTGVSVRCAGFFMKTVLGEDSTPDAHRASVRQTVVASALLVIALIPVAALAYVRATDGEATSVTGVTANAATIGLVMLAVVLPLAAGKLELEIDAVGPKLAQYDRLLHLSRRQWRLEARINALRSRIEASWQREHNAAWKSVAHFRTYMEARAHRSGRPSESAPPFTQTRQSFNTAALARRVQEAA